MSIPNWAFWYWLGLFLTGPILFFSSGARLFPRMKNEKAKNAFKLVDLIGLVVVCLTSFVSFIMMWQSIVGWGYWSLLVILTFPIGLFFAIKLWDYGMLLLIVKSGVTVISTLSDDTKIIEAVRYEAGQSK